MPDNRFIHEPNFSSKEIQSFLEGKSGVLKHHMVELDQQLTPASHVINVASFGLTYWSVS
jgi:hypothetical protein